MRRGSGARYGLGAEQPVLMLMPGSRRSEVPRLLPVFGQTLALLARAAPDLRPVLPVSAVVAEHGPPGGRVPGRCSRSS